MKHHPIELPGFYGQQIVRIRREAGPQLPYASDAAKILSVKKAVNTESLDVPSKICRQEFAALVDSSLPIFLRSREVGNIPGTTQLAGGGIQGETRQILENIGRVLERYGSSMERVVKCLVMIDDMAEWPAMNEVYAGFFPGAKPARSALGADGLALGARVEIECMATVG